MWNRSCRVTTARPTASSAVEHAQDHQSCAQQSTSARQMRWSSTVLSNSRTWFALEGGDIASGRSCRGAIQRSEIGSYHLPGLITGTAPSQAQMRYAGVMCRLRHRLRLCRPQRESNAREASDVPSAGRDVTGYEAAPNTRVSTRCDRWAAILPRSFASRRRGALRGSFPAIVRCLRPRAAVLICNTSSTAA